MEAKFAEALGSGRRVVVDLKRRRAAKFASPLMGVPRRAVPQVSTLKSSSVKLGKRKKSDACNTKCRSCKLASHGSLVRYYMNFMKSGLPRRLMFYQQGKWIDHDSEVVGFIRKEFEHRKAAVEVNINSYHLIFDFVRMNQFNFKTSAEQPVAWIDEEGCCFFPETFTDANGLHGNSHTKILGDELTSFSGPHGVQEIKLQIEIEVNGAGDSKSVEYSGESSPVVKRIKVGQNAEVEDSFDKVSDARMKEDVGEYQRLEDKLDAEKAQANLDSDAVEKLFLNGMNLAVGANVVDICSNSNSLQRGRLELFLKQVEITKRYRGNPNIQYAWLASSKETSSDIMTYGFGHFGLQQLKSTCGIGVHLTAAHCADTSASYCDVDENGVRHMVLCRVILGNVEVIHPGSMQFLPSSQNFDTGVDDIENPRQYIVWSMNMNTHIYPEYVVSFKIPANHEGCVLKNDGKVDVCGDESAHIRFVKPSSVGAVLDNESDPQSNLTCDGSKERTSSLSSTTVRGPTSPWLPLPVLLALISKQIPPIDMKPVIQDYELFRMKKITRGEFVKNLRTTVGDTLLRSILSKLSCKPPTGNKVMVGPKQEIDD